MTRADSALRLGLLSPDDRRPLLRASRRGASQVRLVAADVDPLSGSVLESLLRMLLAP